jgi:hypothetical protein
MARAKERRWLMEAETPEDPPNQGRLFDNGEPQRRKPTPEELQESITEKVRIVVWKWHRGRPPKGMSWEDLFQEVSLRALFRIRNFMHGGKYTLGEYTYMAACYSLADIQRENMRQEEKPPQDYPLLDKWA